MRNFVVNADGTVTDTGTGLMWKRAAEGKFTFDEAVERFVGKDEFAGFNDWRLPTIDELKTLLLGDREAFPDMPDELWSGSLYAGYSSLAWFVDFYYGLAGNDVRYDALGVRLVRAGQ